MPLNDDQRYIEYLQEQLLDPDWSSVFDASKWQSWVSGMRSIVPEVLQRTSNTGSSYMAAYFERIEVPPETRYELPTSRAIFEPILEEVKKAAITIGIRPVREIRIYTSTDHSATPAARPTASEHLLFIGLGTSSFCNYWAKCLALIASSIQPVLGFARVEDAEQLKKVFKANPSGLILALRLGLYYATFGTMIGFGIVNPKLETLGYRGQLLDAMETFILAHEFSHFVFEERMPETSGSLGEQESQKLESLCDELGLALSRECGNASENYLGFAGVGAVVSFRAIQLCETIRELLRANYPEIPIQRTSNNRGSHPPTEERIALVKEWVINKTADDQKADVKAFIEEYDQILSITLSMIIDAMTSGSTNPSE